MAKDGMAEPPPFPGSEDEHRQVRREFREMAERVRARVVHLNDLDRNTIERAVRVLRAYFVDRRSHAPRQGTLHALMLVGDHADTTRPMIRSHRERPDFEIWAFVDHEAYRGIDQHWGKARQMLQSEVGHFATITLSVFSIAEVARFRLTNRFLDERYGRGLVLYDRAMDPARDTAARAVHDRIMAAIDGLPDRPREAFRCYRECGFDLAFIAKRVGVGPAGAERLLSEAAGRLISALRNDAHARSTRPGIGDHPRHNLDLYHRPGDHDRLIAISLYQFARDFEDVMIEAAEGGRPATVVYQAAYAAEFALKSLLLRAGYSDDWNRLNVGLDIGRALREALKCGLPAQPPDVEHLIERLTRYHDGGRTHEQAAEVLAAIPPSAIVQTIHGLIHTVGETTGYNGVVREGRS